MMNDLEKLVEEARARFDAVADEAGLADAKAAFLGKSGALTALLKGLASLAGAEKAERGKALNQVKQRIEAQLNARIEAIRAERLAQRLASERLDVSLPGRGAATGGLHPVTLTIERVEQIFRSIGFDVADGPEIEEDYFNFTALNIPPNHPARSMADTFYIERPAGSQADASAQPLVLRTHTSPMQVRYARMNQAPLKVIVPGKTYRVDSDATHSPMFHQVEGLWVDENISFADLKSVYTDFLHRFFERDDIDVRFRPSYFPFTEPSAEVDVSCGICHGEGCRFCKHTGWIEVLGCGMVDPNVYGFVGIDPEKYSGFAFGIGVERIAALKYNVPDLRMLLDGDMRFLRQF